MKDKWLKDLRDCLSDYEMDAPEGLWESLQEDMPVETEPIVDNMPERTRVRTTWYRRLIVAASIIVALIAGTGLGLWLGYGGRLDSNEIKIAAENKGVRQSNKNRIPQNNDNRFSGSPEATVKEITVAVEEVDNISTCHHTAGTAPVVRTGVSAAPECGTGEVPVDIEETSGSKIADECEVHDKDDIVPHKSAGPYGPLKHTRNNPTHYADLHLNIKRNKIQEGRYYVGIITSGMGSTATDMRRKINNPNYIEPDNNPGSNQDPNIDQTNPDPGSNSSDGLGFTEGDDPNSTTPDNNSPGDTGDDDNAVPTVPEPPVSGEDKYIDEITKVRHHKPIRFGLTFQYNFNRRLGIETGVMYTRLASDVTIYSTAKTETGRQTLHYVGIPVNIKFSAWSWKCFDLYMSAGVTGEKCVRNELITTTLAANTYNETQSLHGEKPFQWSGNLSAGLQIRLAPTVGIFAEPGVSYYFDDGSSLSTIYKEKPCNFNINLGLRLTFGNAHP